jgi:16S rRNA processing protein RimM
MTQDSYISIGRIVRSRGLQGEVVVQPFSDDPERFRRLEEVILTSDRGSTSNHKLAFVRLHRKKGRDEVHLRLEGVESRDASDELRGCILNVRRDDLGLTDGEHFLFDLIGMSVVSDSGEPLGSVSDVRRLPAQDIIVVSDSDGRESLVPDVAAFVDKSAIDQGKLVITPIEGLFDL